MRLVSINDVPFDPDDRHMIGGPNAITIKGSEREKVETPYPSCNKNPSDIKPLMCSASPRDIPQVLSQRALIPCDKYWAKYYQEGDAYKILRDFFLENKEYTHMIIAPDDLVIRPRDYEDLVQDLLKTDYPILAGICNLSWSEMDRYSPSHKADLTTFFTEEDLKGEPIRKVEYEGFGCTFLRRDIVEKIEFNGFKRTYWAYDFGLAVECYMKNIPIHVDTRVWMLHLKNRLGNGNAENWGRDIKEPTVIYEKI
jgi:hypothetical protein